MTTTIPEKTLTQAIVQEMKTAGMRFYVHVPSSEHRPLFTLCGQDPFFRMVTACHEGDAVTIACGLSIAGRGCLVAIENAGLFQAAEALRAMAIDMQIPLVLLVGNQGSISLKPNVSPEEALDGLRARMGAAATHLQQQQRLAPRMLEVLGVPFAFMEDATGARLLHWAAKKAEEIRGPVALFHSRMD